MNDPVLKHMYESGKKLSELLHITKKDIDKALEDMRNQV
jgi:biotin operon repressor